MHLYSTAADNLCNNEPRKIDQSLQYDIRQSVIQVQLNLTQMGYRQAATVQTKNTLTYTILHNMYGFIICMFLLIRPISAQA